MPESQLHQWLKEGERKKGRKFASIKSRIEQPPPYFRHFDCLLISIPPDHTFSYYYSPFPSFFPHFSGMPDPASHAHVEPRGSTPTSPAVLPHPPSPAKSRDGMERGSGSPFPPGTSPFLPEHALPSLPEHPPPLARLCPSQRLRRLRFPSPYVRDVRRDSNLMDRRQKAS